MSDRYLWDRSGPPDPEVERLEKTLAPLRYRHRADLVRAADARPRLAWAAAAASILCGIALWQFQARPFIATGWQVASIEGGAHLGNAAAAVDMTLHAGQSLRTAGDGQLTLRADDLGRIDLGPNSEIRAASTRQVNLGRGLLHAFIWARPGQFVVDTPSSRAIDLGCEYTINVDAQGDGLLKVALGWVAFQFGGHESFIPAGAECVTRRKLGPGIPYYEDSSEPLQQAVGRFQRGDRGAVTAILAEARSRDGLTLWHLLTRVPPEDRPVVFDRFAQLVALTGVDRDAVLRKDPAAIDRCWDALNLENTGWWRGWERKW
jgi:FecR-like protein